MSPIGAWQSSRDFGKGNEIKSVLKSSLDSLRRLKKIAAHSASDEDDFRDAKVEGKPESLIFIRYNPENGWYSFTAGVAMESKEMTDKIHGGEPKPVTPIKGMWGCFPDWF